MSTENKEYIYLPTQQPALRLVPMPSDLNPAGDVFGGWIMSHVDVAGAIPAMKLSQGKVVTVAVNSFLFKEPISVGDLVSFYAKVIHVGNTSMKVKVEVYAEHDIFHAHVVKVTEAELTYVAVDSEGKKRKIVLL